MSGPSAAAVIGIEWTFLTVALGLIFARLYLRINFMRQGLILSDYFLFLAWIASVAIACVDIAYKYLGLLSPDVHLNLKGLNVNTETFEVILKLIFAKYFPWYMALYLCKATILAFYFLLFPTITKYIRILLWAATSYTLVAYLITNLLTILICLPVQRNWSLGDDACPTNNPAVVFRIAWALHFTSDVIIFALPFLVLREMQLRTAQKVGVILTFGLGIINLTVCITRFLLVDLKNEVIGQTTLELFSAVDAYTSLIIAILPSLRPYLRIWQGRSAFSDGDYIHSYRRRSTALGIVTIRATAVRSDTQRNNSISKGSQDHSRTRKESFGESNSAVMEERCGSEVELTVMGD